MGFFKGLGKVCKGVGVFLAGCVSVPLAIAGGALIATGIILQGVGAIVAAVLAVASLATCCFAPIVAPLLVYPTGGLIYFLGQAVAGIGVGCMFPLAATIEAADGCCVCDDSDDDRRVRADVSDNERAPERSRVRDRMGGISRAISFVSFQGAGIKLGDQVEGQENSVERRVEGQARVADRDLERGEARDTRAAKAGVVTQYRSFQAVQNTAPKFAGKGRNDETLRVNKNESGSGSENKSAARSSDDFAWAWPRR